MFCNFYLLVYASTIRKMIPCVWQIIYSAINCITTGYFFPYWIRILYFSFLKLYQIISQHCGSPFLWIFNFVLFSFSLFLKDGEGNGLLITYYTSMFGIYIRKQDVWNKILPFKNFELEMAHCTSTQKDIRPATSNTAKVGHVSI